LRSDVERKRLAGLAEREPSHSPPGGGLYSSDATNRVYERLAIAAEHILSGGYTAIVDATFSHRNARDVFQKVARHLGIPACLIECQAPQEVLTSRISARAAQGNDASEANVDVLTWQRRHWEPLAADEGWLHLSVDTSLAQIEELCQRIGKLRELQDIQ
jgi:uncharacterized protein